MLVSVIYYFIIRLAQSSLSFIIEKYYCALPFVVILHSGWRYFQRSRNRNSYSCRIKKSGERANLLNADSRRSASLWLVMQRIYACLLPQWARVASVLPQNFWCCTRLFMINVCRFHRDAFSTMTEDGKVETSSRLEILFRIFLSLRQNLSIPIREIPRSSLARVANCHGGSACENAVTAAVSALCYLLFDRYLRASCVNRKLSARAISTSHGHIRILHNSDRLYLSGRHSSSVNIRSIRIPAENSLDARRIFIASTPASRWRRFISASSKTRNLNRPVHVPGCKNIWKRSHLSRRSTAVEWQEKKREIRVSQRYSESRLNSLDDERTKFARERDLLLRREFLSLMTTASAIGENIIAHSCKHSCVSLFDTFLNLTLIALVAPIS